MFYLPTKGFFDHDLVRQAVLHELATHTLPLAFFATHYGSLTDDFAYHPNIRNMHMSTMLDDEKHEASELYLCNASRLTCP
jgi:DNA mismatch repair protein MSH6